MVHFVVLRALVDALRFLLRGVVFVARLFDVAVLDARVLSCLCRALFSVALLARFLTLLVALVG